MKAPITLDTVRQAIMTLQGQGERVSRRNVLALTGGGMSTVHRLMIQVEEIDAQKALAAATGLSASLLAAINTEIADNISRTLTTTTLCQGPCTGSWICAHFLTDQPPRARQSTGHPHDLRNPGTPDRHRRHPRSA